MRAWSLQLHFVDVFNQCEYNRMMHVFPSQTRQHKLIVCNSRYFVSGELLYYTTNTIKMGGGLSRRKRIDSWQRVQQKAMSPVKEGVLLKQSKYLKEWRRRSVVLKSGHIFTFKMDSGAQPTVAQNFQDIQSFLKEDNKGDFLLVITTKWKMEYKFKTRSESERDEWYEIIKLEKQRILKVSTGMFASVVDDKNSIEV